MIKTLKAFNLLIDVYQPIAVAACSTAAMREADNQQEVLQRIKLETGIDLEIISGLEEAKIISKSTKSNMEMIYEDTLFIDVGGGSTEISYFRDGAFVQSKSFSIGTIRLLLDKVPSTEWDDLKDWITEVRKSNGEVNCICSGGNINKLTKIFGDVDTYTISREQLWQAYETLSGLSLEERMANYGMREDRADVIVPAALIFKKIMKWGRITNLIAPRIGLADGLTIQLFKEHKRKLFEAGA
jgi:exopolyphosphatase / guanosine-5'-triphosphate,3'-diphosphate pyrophosphatase